ncbi:MAG: hypothetical protein ACREX8_14995, partial [Gammaproteobacteria bacterium]
ESLPANPLIELDFGWGLAEVSSLAGFAKSLFQGGPQAAEAMCGAWGLGEVGEDAGRSIRCQ